jgi:hypothetical protein
LTLTEGLDGLHTGFGGDHAHTIPVINLHEAKDICKHIQYIEVTV